LLAKSAEKLIKLQQCTFVQTKIKVFISKFIVNEFLLWFLTFTGADLELGSNSIQSQGFVRKIQPT